MTSLQKPDKFLLNSLSINSATGALSLPSSSQQLVPTGQEPEHSGVEYAAPLCTSLDGEHVYVVYPSEKVSFEEIPSVVRVFVVSRWDSVLTAHTNPYTYPCRQDRRP